MNININSQNDLTKLNHIYVKNLMGSYSIKTMATNFFQ